VLRLDAHDAAAPRDAAAVVERVLEGLGQLPELALVLVLDGGEGEGCCGLLVDDGAQAGLALWWLRWGGGAVGVV